MRCAVCGSTRIVTETRKEGYNLKKGIVGSVLFGGMGAIAGTSGNEVTYYHCGDCGQTLNKCMHEYEEMELEFALKTQDSEYAFFINRVNEMKNKYPNAGWDENKILNAHIKMKNNKSKFDENDLMDISSYIKRHGSISKAKLVNYIKQNGYNDDLANAVESYFMDISTHKYRVQIDFNDNDLIFSYYDGDDFIVEKRPLYHHNGLAVIQTRKKFDKQKMESENEELKKIIINIVKNNNKPMRINELMEADERIANFSTQKIRALCWQLMDKDLLKPEDIIDNAYDWAKRRKQETSTKNINEKSKTNIGLENQKLCQEIYNVLKEYGSLTISEMKQKSEILNNVGDFKLRVLCRKGVSDGKLICLDENMKKYSII